MTKENKKLNFWLVMIPILISGIVACIPGDIFAQYGVLVTNKHHQGEPNVASAMNALCYYDDYTPEIWGYLAWEEYLQVRYDLGTPSIIMGAQFLHGGEAAGATTLDLDILMQGDSASLALWNLAVPRATDATWLYSTGYGTYVVDDDPWITFQSNNNITDSLAIGCDTPHASNSFYSTDQGATWKESTTYEWMIDVLYENIGTLVAWSSQSGNISGWDILDAYNVTLTGGKQYCFTLSLTSGIGNLNMRLVPYTVGGTTGTAVNATTGSNYPEKLYYTPSTTTTYLLLVEPAVAEGDEASYSIVYGENTPPDDSYEDNDALGSAWTLTAGTYPMLACADDDWYRINVAAGYSITATISFTHASGDLDLRLYNAGGTLLDSSESTNDFEQVSYAVTTNGYYYIKVYRYTGSGYNNYTLSLGTTVTDDTYEDNDVQGSAWLLSAGTYPALVCADDDWYRIYVTSGSIVTASISFTHANGNLDLKLFNMVGTLLNASTSMVNTEQVSYNVTETGYYYVQVYRATGSGYNSYALTLGTTVIDDGYENNDGQGSANLLSTGTYSSLVCADDDWYRTYVTAGYTVTATISFVHANGDLELQLYNAGGTLLDSSSTISNSEVVSYNVTTSGYYYIRAYRFSGSDYNNYSLTLSTSVTDDRYEENDVRAAATTLGAGTYDSLVCADNDWFRIYVNGGYTVTARITFIHASGNLDLKLYDSSGSELNASTSASNVEAVSFDVFYTGYYYAQVYRATGSGFNGYTLALELVQDPTETLAGYNYDDISYEYLLYVYSGQYLQVRYNLGQTRLILGVQYYHVEASATGPFSVNFRFVGDTGSVLNTASVPASASGEWRAFINAGPSFLIDDNPWVQFESAATSTSNCLIIGGDEPQHSTSYYSSNQGATWQTSPSSEYHVDILYEPIQTLVAGNSKNGDISGLDLIDAYYVTLTARTTYEFTLTRSIGAGNLNMRLVNFVSGGTTGSAVNSTAGTSYPEQMQYTPVADTTHLLLVEPATDLTDIARYSLVMTIIATPPPETPQNPDNPAGPDDMPDTSSGGIAGYDMLLLLGATCISIIATYKKLLKVSN